MKHQNIHREFYYDDYVYFSSAAWLPQGQLMLIIAFDKFRPESHREPCNEVESQSWTEHLVRFEPGKFRFLLQ